MDGHLQEENTEQIQAEENKQEKKDEKRRRHIIATLLLLLIIIILILLLLRQCSSSPPVLNPDYPPQQDDPNASPIPGDDDDKLDHDEGGGAVSLQYSDALTIDLSDRSVALKFANPGRSTQDMVLYILIQDHVIVQSGRIRPGYEVSRLDLLEDAENMLSEGIYEGMFVIYYYDPETNERAMVNTEAPVTITVQP